MAAETITTVLVAAANDALVDLETIKSELNIDAADTSSDDWLNRTIGQVTRSIESYCNRTFQIEVLFDATDIGQDPFPYQTPGGVKRLQLARYPLANFGVLKLASAAAPGDVTLDFGKVAPSGIISAPGIPAGSTYSGNEPQTLSNPVRAAMPAGTSVAFGIEVAQTISATSQQILGVGIHYVIDGKAGQLTRINESGVARIWEALPLTITYSAGYPDVPDDVVVAALRWMVWRWSERTRDPTLKATEQPLVGTKSYWVGGPPMSGGVPQEIAELLDNYRVPVVY